MKLARFAGFDGLLWGVVVEGGILDVTGLVGTERGAIHGFLDKDGLERLADHASGRTADAKWDETALAPLLPDPEKIICVGVNYPDRNAEYRDGSEAPPYPSLFIRVPSSFTAHAKPLVRPRESTQLDYEGEVAVIIGKPGRRITRDRALEHVAGMTLVNEGTARDWVRHGKFNVTQGKNFDRSGSIGPWMVALDSADQLRSVTLQTRVNGELRQNDTLDNMIFPVDALIEYISAFTTLRSGDVISTGTPTGSGARLDPPRYLEPGDVVEVSASGIGMLRNEVIDG